jgi:hypothetical protein
MLDSELVGVGAELAAGLADLPVVPEAGGEGEQPHPDAGAGAGSRTTCPSPPAWSPSSGSEAESSSSSRRRTSGRREAVRPAPAPARGGRPRARTGDGTVGREGCARRRGRRADSPAAADYRGAPRLRLACPRARSHRGGRGARAPPRARLRPHVLAAALADPIRCYARRTLPTRGGGVLDAEPQPVAAVSTAGLPSGARAFGEFVDLKVGFLTGHSSRVAELAAAAAEALGCSRTEVSDVRAAAQRSWSVPRQPLDAAFLFAVS